MLLDSATRMARVKHLGSLVGLLRLWMYTYIRMSVLQKVWGFGTAFFALCSSLSNTRCI